MATYPQPIAEYQAYINQVNLVNDIYNGKDTAKKHLQKFDMEKQEEFKKRLETCTIDSYVERSINSRKNIIFRKPISLEGVSNSKLKDYCENDFDLKGTSLNEFAKEWLTLADKDGFCFALIDTPQKDETIVTKLDEEQNNIRPYATLIKRKDLFYWETDSYGNYKVIAFYESYQVREDGLFGFETKIQVKAMFNDGTVRIFREDKEVANYYRDTKDILIYKLGKSDIPMFYNMANINIKQMNRESELSHYTRITLNPTPISMGDLKGSDDEEGTVKTLSANQGLHFEDKESCDFKWVEVSGKSHEVGVKEIDRLAEQMTRDSISFATESNVKTATQVEKDATEDESRLTDRAQMLEKGINKLLEYYSVLNPELGKDQLVEVNKDFSTNKLSPEQQDKLISLYVQDVISRDRLLRALERGEVLEILNAKDEAKEKTLLLDNTGIEE